MKLIIALIAFTTSAFAQNAEQMFKDAFLRAVKSNQTSALMALTCMDNVTPEWKSLLDASDKSLLLQLQNQQEMVVSFKSFDGPQPAPIHYRDTLLMPNLPITTICTISLGDTKAASASSTQLRLGTKDGKLMMVALVPQKGTTQPSPTP